MTDMRKWVADDRPGPVILAILAGCGSGGDADDGSTQAGPDDHRRRLEHRLPDQQGGQEDFSSVDPDVTVVVDEHGTGGGFARYLEGEVDIVDASRPAKPDEESKAKDQGIEWTRFLVGYDGITLVVNPKNDFVKSLTVDS